LQHLLAPEYVADYFYYRAQTLAADGESSTALAEVERGLTYAGSAELHLLAAILAQRVGRFDQMRHHVAAIAVDDTLRPEAEWLLRAHQARQRALRAGAQQPQAAQAAVVSTPAIAFLDDFLDELLGRNARPQGQTRIAQLQSLLPTVALAALVGLAVVAYLWLSQESAAVNGTVATQDEGPPQAAPAAAESGTTSDAGVEEPQGEEPSLLPTPTATPDLPGDVVQSPRQGEPLADSDVRRAVIVSASPFDLETVLQDAGRPDLLALGLNATLQGEKLLLQGVVHMDRQRRELVELVATAPGIEEISTTNLLLQPLPSYTVQEGDTLWSIVYDIYGDDAARIDELFQLNLDLLPSPDSLRPGMELKVPPVS
jgi:nucleoid-associated protein YgaU